MTSTEKVTCKVTCGTCNKTFNLEVFNKDFLNFSEGALVQRCFPYLSADERELFVTGMCGKCYDDIFV